MNGPLTPALSLGERELKADRVQLTLLSNYSPPIPAPIRPLHTPTPHTTWHINETICNMPWSTPCHSRLDDEWVMRTAREQHNDRRYHSCT